MGNQPAKQQNTVIIGYARPHSAERPRRQSLALVASALAAATPNTANNTNDDEQNEAISYQSHSINHSRIEAELVAQNFEPVTTPAHPRPFGLQLVSKRLVYISPQITFAVHLHTLELQRNNLMDLPDELAELQCLTWLDISHNKFKKLPRCIESMTSLLELKASFNQITHLSPEFCRLDKLMTLSLAHNQLASIPDYIIGLDSLVTLTLSFNPIRVLPSQIGRLKYLRQVSLESCPLHSRATWNAEQQQQQQSLLGVTANKSTTTTATPPPTATPTTPAAAAATTTTTSAATTPTTTTTTSTTPRVVLTLRELAARVVVRHSIPVVGPIPQEVTDYLGTCHTCDTCGGPYFQRRVQRLRFIEKNGDIIPMVYLLCSEHWRSEGERVRSMFLPKPATAPRPLDRFESERVLLRMSSDLCTSRSSLRLNKSTSRDLSAAAAAVTTKSQAVVNISSSSSVPSSVSTVTPIAAGMQSTSGSSLNTSSSVANSPSTTAVPRRPSFMRGQRKASFSCAPFSENSSSGSSTALDKVDEETVPMSSAAAAAAAAALNIFRRTAPSKPAFSDEMLENSTISSSS